MKYLKKYERVIKETDNDYHELSNKLYELNNAVECCNLNKIKIILSRNKNLINSVDENGDGKTPLLIAITNTYADATRYVSAKLLIDLGADVNIPDNKDYTPLLYAIQIGNVEIVEKLINAGADASYVSKGEYAKYNKSINIFHNSPLLKAMELYHMWYNDREKKHDGDYIKIIEMLINAGADLEYQVRGLTPLLLSISTKSKEVTYLLIKNGANLNAKNKDDIDAFSLLSKLDQKYVINNYPKQYEIYSFHKKADKFNI